MARRDAINIPLKNYNGSNNFGPINLLPEDRYLFVEWARCTTANPTIWPSFDTVIELLCELSFDNGATWEFAGGSEERGGIQTRFGVEVPLGAFIAQLRPAAQRQLRISATIVNGPLRTSGTVGLLS